jgi:MFS transporter, UMF1 family
MQTTITEKNNKKVMNAWCMYDWANSVYPLTITSAIFPIYWTSQTKGGVDILGMHFSGSILFSYCLSLAFLVIALVNPILSGIADSAGNKKSFMKAFVLIGAISCFGMNFFDSAHVWIGVLTFILGTIGYAGSIVFYNAYLPEIATEDRFDRLSAKGFSMGYLGGVVLLVINLVFIMNPEILYNVNAKTLEILDQSGYSMKDGVTVYAQDMDPKVAHQQALDYFAGKASRLAFVTVGIWWILFSQIPFYFLPKNTSASGGVSFSRGYKELKKVFGQIRQSGLIKKYLAAFFFYSMGVQTVMYVATLFADVELKMPAKNLIITVLIIQLIAILGSYLFSVVSKKLGNIYALLILNLVWICICIAAYQITSINAFYMLAAVVGFVMGGIQSLSRSTYAKMIPGDTPDHASYFSFYEFTEKIAIVIGTFFFGFIEFAMLKISGEVSMRYSVVSLMVFFIVGSLLLLRIRKEKIED